MSSIRVTGVALVTGLVALLVEIAASRAADRPTATTLPATLPAPARVAALDDRQLCALHATLYPDAYGELAASHPTQPQGQLEAAVLDELRERRRNA
jgi:hypothetical protein